MSTETSLKAKIQELETQLETINLRQADLRRRMEAQNNANIRRMESQLKEAMEENKRRLDNVYTQKVQQMRQNLIGEMQRQIDEIRHQDAEAQAKRQALVAQLKAATEELSAEMERIKDDVARSKTASKEVIKQLCDQAEDKVKIISELPYAFFSPGRFEVLREHLQTVQNMLSLNMYDAAAATAGSALSELELLEIQIQEQLREWEEIFCVYKQLVTRLKKLLDDFEKEEISTPAGTFHLNYAQREYWSENAFGRISSDIRNAYALVESIEAEGIKNYLKTGQAFKGFQFARQITKLYELADQLSAVISCIRNERGFSDERFVLAEKTEDALEDRGYSVVGAQFRGENLMDCFELEVTINNGRDIERISFVPVRRNGIAEGTACMVTISGYTYPNPEALWGQAQDIIALIQGIAPSVQTQWFAEGDANAETYIRSMNQPPSVAQYTHVLARKYHT